MALITLPFTVTGQQLEFTQPVLAERAVGSIGATFSFSDEWATLTTRTATFAIIDAAYDVALVSDSCTVPSEVLASSSFRVSVRGSDGTHDSYDAVSGVLTKRMGKVVLDGSADEVWSLAYTSNPDTYGFQSFQITLPLVPASGWGTGNKITCDRFPSRVGTVVYYKTGNGICNDALKAIICISDTLATDVATFKTWLSSNPVTVYYALATPTTVQLTPHLPVVRTGIKTLSIGADVVPTISATVKSMD